MACKYMHIVNTVTVNSTASTVTLGFVNAATADDEDKFCFKIPCAYAIPSTAATFPVSVTVNGDAIPLWDRYGNPVNGSDLKCCKLYKGYYGATTPHVIIKNAPFVCNTSCNNVL